MKKILLSVLILMMSVPAFAADKESAYERVIRTGTIRCGYMLWSPILSKDAETGAFSGVGYDVMTEVAKRLGMKIDWTEEAGMDVILQGAQNGRYDMVCTPLYANSSRGKISYFSTPLYFSPVYVVTRANDNRFDKDQAVLNDPQYKLAMLDGEITAILGPQHFPKVTPHNIPQLQGYSFVLKDVDLGKADATIADIMTVMDYNKNNVEKLKFLSKPLAVNAVAFPLPRDGDFKQMMDTVFHEMIYDGWFENLLDTKYPEYKASIMMNAPAYAERQ